MEQQVKNATEWIKAVKDVKGCITGSSLLEYFPDADIDVFLYDEHSFKELFYAMYHNSLFTILDKTELWKADKYRKKGHDYKDKFGILTIKFMYNTCIPVNLVLKRNATNIFGVLSSFDMDIICKGYDLETKQVLDLSQNLPDKKATWNTWNTSYYTEDIWEISRILRQLSRCFKYAKRGYDTDLVVLKYMDIIEKIQEHDNIFNSDRFDSILSVAQNNTKLVKELCQIWLDTHEITDEQIELLNQKIKEI